MSTEFTVRRADGGTPVLETWGANCEYGVMRDVSAGGVAGRGGGRKSAHRGTGRYESRSRLACTSGLLEVSRRNDATSEQPRLGHSGHMCRGKTLNKGARKSNGGNQVNRHNRSPSIA